LTINNFIGLRHQNPQDKDKVRLQCWCSQTNWNACHPNKFLWTY